MRPQRASIFWLAMTVLISFVLLFSLQVMNPEKLLMAKTRDIDDGSSKIAIGKSGSVETVVREKVVPTEPSQVLSSTNSFLGKAQVAANENTVILVYASFSYRESLLNWLVNLKRTERDPINGVLLICLDEELRDFVTNLGWDCFLEDFSQKGASDGTLDRDSVKSLWVVRVTHIRTLLDGGISVILSDTDAVWLKDVTQFFSKDQDVVASKADFPYKSPWGATLCMGLIFFRATPSVAHLATLALEQTKIFLDDQIGFNNVLFSLKFSESSGQKLPFGRMLSPTGTSWANATFILQNSVVRVALIPHSVVPRSCKLIAEADWKHVAVGHCHVNDGKPAPTNKHKGNQATHMAILVKYNLYFLAPEWESILVSSKHKDFRKHLSSIQQPS